MADVNVALPTPTEPWQDRMASDQFDVAAAGGPLWRRLGVGGAILKAQGAICRDLHDGRGLSTYGAGFLMLTLLASSAYGAVVGSFAGWPQAGYATLKFPIVVIGSALMCLPSFYVFQCLSGARLTLAQAATAVLYFSAAAGMLLLAFAPIAWFFTVSTEVTAWRFIVALHFSVSAIAAAFGIGVLNRAERYLACLHPGTALLRRSVLSGWFLLYLIVAAQMAYYLRPLLWPGPFWTGERGLFLEALGPFFSGSR